MIILIFKLFLLILIFLFIKLFIVRFDIHDYFTVSITLLIIFLGYLYIVSSHVFLVLLIFISSVSLIIYSFFYHDSNESSLIIVDGIINFKNMYKNKYAITRLLNDLKRSGVSFLNKNNCGVLKNGELTLYYKRNTFIKYPIPIIFDGRVDYDGLNMIKKKEKWLDDILKKEKVDYQNIFFAFYYKNNLYLIKKENYL